MPKVYCDRLATVVESAAGQIQCPKCKGPASRRLASKTVDYDCTLCGRGWEIVPDTVTTEAEALEFLETKYR